MGVALLQQLGQGLGAAVAAVADQHERAPWQIGLADARERHIEAAGDVATGVFHRFAHIDHLHALLGQLVGQVVGADAWLAGTVGHGCGGGKSRVVLRGLQDAEPGAMAPSSG